MLKYDTEAQHMTIAGSGGEIMSDVIALTVRVCNSITRGNYCLQNHDARA